MADWIKMRSSLPSQPRVTKMARTLLANPAFISWSFPFLSETQLRDAAVTKAVLPVVTLSVVGALLSVWAMVNDTAGRDGIVRHATSLDMDGIAGIPGFGDALKAVEWLEDLPDGTGVRFINFEEHNSPQKERSSPTSKSGAERQKTYRERKRAGVKGDEKGDGEGDATDASRGDDREKREKEKKTTPKTPKGEVEIPDWMPVKQWDEFVAMRRAKGSRAPFTVGAARGIVQKLEEYRGAGHDPAAILDASIINGWSDVFEPKGKPAQPPAQGSFV